MTIREILNRHVVSKKVGYSATVDQVAEYVEKIKSGKTYGYLKLTPAKVIGEDTLNKEYYKKVDGAVAGMTLAEKAELIKSMSDKEVWTRNGYRPALNQYISANEVREVVVGRDSISFTYMKQGIGFYDHSSDGFRVGGGTYNTEEKVEAVLDLTKDSDLLNRTANNCYIERVYTKSTYKEELQAQGYEIVYRIREDESLSIHLDDLYAIFKDAGEIELFVLTFGEVYNNYIKELQAEIAKKEEILNKIETLVNSNQELIKEYKFYANKKWLEVTKGRKGDVVIFKRKGKLKVFDRNITTPKAGEYISVEEEVELDRICIIKKYINYKVYEDLKKKLTYDLEDDSTVFLPDTWWKVGDLKNSIEIKKKILNSLTN